MTDQELANFRDALVLLLQRKIDGRNIDVTLVIADRAGDKSCVATTYENKYPEDVERSILMASLFVLLQENAEFHPVIQKCRDLMAKELLLPANDDFTPMN